VSVISDVRYTRVKKYSRKYTIGYIANTRKNMETHEVIIKLEIFYFYFSHGVRLSPLGTAATTGLFYQPQMIDDDYCGAVGGMRIGR
jgi:hypothetical protein